MAQYDVYPIPRGTGWLLDLQSDLLDVIGTRVVAPLVPLAEAQTRAGRLNPVFRIEGEEVVMLAQSLAAVPTSILKERCANLAQHHDKITAALDMVFLGF
jgi:toxin CcdB